MCEYIKKTFRKRILKTLAEKEGGIVKPTLDRNVSYDL